VTRDPERLCVASVLYRSDQRYRCEIREPRLWNAGGHARRTTVCASSTSMPLQAEIATARTGARNSRVRLHWRLRSRRSNTLKRHTNAHAALSSSPISLASDAHVRLRRASREKNTSQQQKDEMHEQHPSRKLHTAPQTAGQAEPSFQIIDPSESAPKPRGGRISAHQRSIKANMQILKLLKSVNSPATAALKIQPALLTMHQKFKMNSVQ
jgi:hypothetical protein